MTSITEGLYPAGNVYKENRGERQRQILAIDAQLCNESALI